MRVQISIVGLLALCLLIPVVGSATTLPTGFAETQIVSGIASPTAMDFSPDGRLFVCEQGEPSSHQEWFAAGNTISHCERKFFRGTRTTRRHI